MGLFSSLMDIETAANFGEMLGGLAILLTLLFGMRQVKQWNETMKINSHYCQQFPTVRD